MENKNEFQNIQGIYLQCFPQIISEFKPFFNSQIELNDPENKLPKKRGRKNLRPHNPTKTEVMDKYWIRGFREFMKSNYVQLKDLLGNNEFWENFLGKNGIPGENRCYLSYSKAYKRYIFSSKIFCITFSIWGFLYGVNKVPRKNFKGVWGLYYEYLFTELLENCKKELTNSENILASTLYAFSTLLGKSSEIVS